MIELLSPAGSFDALKACVSAGADAVYAGGVRFGARAFAQNFDGDNFIKAIDYVHKFNKKIYMTVNTLLKQTELEEDLIDYIKPFYEEGIDAVIVQDMGVMELLHENFPKLALHASTQVNILMPNEASMLPVTRIVPARELTLDEIKFMRANTDKEIECFVHGALCYSYSGQCLLSSMCGGRSGNRGMCAGSCRLAYTQTQPKSDEKKCLLSLKDMCTLEFLPDLIDAGIDSLKIEGRMKKPEYAAGVTAVYKKWIDRYYEMGPEAARDFYSCHQEKLKSDIMELADLYNRGGFSSGYFLNGQNSRRGIVKESAAIAPERPNHYGVLAGKVEAVTERNVRINYFIDMNAHDVVEIRRKGKQIYEYTLKDGIKAPNRVYANILRGTEPFIGDDVFRTRNAALIDKIQAGFLNKEKKIPVKACFTAKDGSPMSLSLETADKYCNRKISVNISGQIVQRAVNNPTSVQRMRDNISKAGNTCFVFENPEDDISMDADDGLFIPVSQINELRRNAFTELEQEIISLFKRKPVIITGAEKDTAGNETDESEMIFKNSLVLATAVNFEQFAVISLSDAVNICAIDITDTDMDEIKKCIDQAGLHNKKMFIELPAICRKDTYEYLKKIMQEIFPFIDGVLVSSLAELELICTENEKNHKHNKKEVKIYINSNLYVANKKAWEYYSKIGADAYTACEELNYSELIEIGSIDSCIITAYGHLALMQTEQCIDLNTKGCNMDLKPGVLYQDGQPLIYQKHCALRKNMGLHDGLCVHCGNTVLDGRAKLLFSLGDILRKIKPYALRLNFTIEDKEEVKRVLENVSVLSYSGHNVKSDVHKNAAKDEYTAHFIHSVI